MLRELVERAIHPLTGQSVVVSEPGVADFEVQMWTLLRPPAPGVRSSRITTKNRPECWSKIT